MLIVAIVPSNAGDECHAIFVQVSLCSHEAAEHLVATYRLSGLAICPTGPLEQKRHVLQALSVDREGIHSYQLRLNLALIRHLWLADAG